MDFIVVRPQGATVSAEPPASLPDDGFVWCDCTPADGARFADAIEALTDVQVLEDHLSDAAHDMHPSIHESTMQYELLIFRSLAQTPDSVSQHGSMRIRTRPTVFFVLPRLLVTVRASDSRIFAAHRARLLETDSDQPRRMPRSPADAMLRLLNDMVDRYLAMRQPLTELLERRQQELLDPRKPFDDWPALLQARTELRKLENLCEEQLDAIQEWRDEHLNRHAHQPALPEAEMLRVRANDLTEHIERVRNHARRLESAVESAVQLHFSAMTHRTSEIMRTLTVLTAIFMPLTLITGIFGMNFDAIPGLHSRAGFWMTIGGMLLVAAALLAYFRVRRYLTGQTATRLRQLRRGERPDRAVDADRLPRTRHTDRAGRVTRAPAVPDGA